jgi:hypothetical protein
MLRCVRIGVVVTLAFLGAALAAASPGRAQTSTFGLFRENGTALPFSRRNCWVQGMISGQTINGEQLARNLTQHQAQCELRRYIRHALCARDLTSDSWSARREPGKSGAALATSTAPTRLDCSGRHAAGG